MTVGLPVCILCNTLGALISFMLSKYFLGEIVQTKFNDKLEFVRRNVQSHRKDLLWYMMSIRAFPASPSWLLNLTYPHVGVPILYFILSVAVGLAPWNFFACKAGVFIHKFNSRDEIMDRDTNLTLFAFALMFLVVPLGRKLTNKFFNKAEKAKPE